MQNKICQNSENKLIEPVVVTFIVALEHVPDPCNHSILLQAFLDMRQINNKKNWPSNYKCRHEKRIENGILREKEELYFKASFT